jgi:hypothetical protein
MSFSQVLSTLKAQAKAVGVSEESFFLQQLHKVSAGGDPTLLQNLVNYANSIGDVTTAAVMQDLLNGCKRVGQTVSDIASGYITVTGSDSVVVPIGFLVDEFYVTLVSPTDPDFITCSPSGGDTASGSLSVHSSSAHNLVITWTVAGTRTIKWLAKK